MLGFKGEEANANMYLCNITTTNYLPIPKMVGSVYHSPYLLTFSNHECLVIQSFWPILAYMGNGGQSFQNYCIPTK